MTDKDNKKYASPQWEAKFNDEYIRANVPSLAEPAGKKWIEAGEAFLNTSTARGEREITNPVEKVLAKVLRAAEAFLDR